MSQLSAQLNVKANTFFVHYDPRIFWHSASYPQGSAEIQIINQMREV